LTSGKGFGQFDIVTYGREEAAAPELISDPGNNVPMFTNMFSRHHGNKPQKLETGIRAGQNFEKHTDKLPCTL
jgi:hypothetical protein